MLTTILLHTEYLFRYPGDGYPQMKRLFESDEKREKAFNAMSMVSSVPSLDELRVSPMLEELC